MKKRFTRYDAARLIARSLIAVLVTAAVALTSATAEAGIKRRIIVAQVKYDRRNPDHNQIYQKLDALLVDALTNSGRFVVLERAGLDDILDELDLGRSGLVRRRTAPSVGRLKGAELIVRAQITDFAITGSGGQHLNIGDRSILIVEFDTPPITTLRLP